jgi:STE24 endopeptidase
VSSDQPVRSADEREQLAHEYEGMQQRLLVIQVVLTVLFLLLFQWMGSTPLVELLERLWGGERGFLFHASYATILLLGFSSLFFPLSYYRGYVLEHHYELSNQSHGAWVSDFIKSLLIDLLITALLFATVYSLLASLAGNWWWVAACIYTLFAVILSTLAPILIMPLFYSFEPLAKEGLTERINERVTAADIPIAGVYRWGLEESSNTANAAFVGMGKTRRIILSDTLLKRCDEDEILAVVAHEIGHCKHQDIWRMMGLNALCALLVFFGAHHLLSRLINQVGVTQIADVSAAPLLLLSLFALSMLLVPVVNAFSRRCEYAADGYAVRSHAGAASLISALEQLSDQNLSVREPHPWIERLLHSHPSLPRRIKYIQSVEQELQP